MGRATGWVPVPVYFRGHPGPCLETYLLFSIQACPRYSKTHREIAGGSGGHLVLEAGTTGETTQAIHGSPEFRVRMQEDAKGWRKTEGTFRLRSSAKLSMPAKLGACYAPWLSAYRANGVAIIEAARAGTEAPTQMAFHSESGRQAIVKAPDIRIHAAKTG